MCLGTLLSYSVLVEFRDGVGIDALLLLCESLELNSGLGNKSLDPLSCLAAPPLFPTPLKLCERT